jgi:hypothetical protein
VTVPPPPPLAALRLSQPPRLSVPAPVVELALLPQWDDASAPLRPAPKASGKWLYWLGSASLSISVGAMVAASLMSVRFGDYAQILPRLRSEAPQAVVASLPAAPVPVQMIEAEQGIEIFANVAAPAQPVLIDELTVTSVSKPAKRAKLTARAARRAQQRMQTSMAAQPDPRDEAEVEAAPAAEAQPESTQPTAAAETTDTQPVEVTEAPAAAVSEPAEVVAPEAPALPESLTRDQVRAGLDALRSKVLSCANGTYGRVLADVTISAPGRVSNAVIEGTFAGTNSGSCMARVLRGAQFPGFSGADISVRYPFSF